MLVKQQSVLTQATTCTSTFILSYMKMRQNKCRRKIPMQKHKFIVNYFRTHNIFTLRWKNHVGKHSVEFFNNNILFIIVGFLLSPLLYSDRIFLFAFLHQIQASQAIVLNHKNKWNRQTYKWYGKALALFLLFGYSKRTHFSHIQQNHRINCL